ncbi:discoidin domain-containing protein [Actinosynnema sp. CA-299493]
MGRTRSIAATLTALLVGAALAAVAPLPAAAAPAADDVVINQELRALVQPVLTASADGRLRALVRYLARTRSHGDTDALLREVVEAAEDSYVVNPHEPWWVELKTAVASLRSVNGFSYEAQVHIPYADEGITTGDDVVLTVAPADERATSAPGFALSPTGGVRQLPDAIDEAYAATKEVWVLSVHEPTSPLPAPQAEEAGGQEVRDQSVCEPTGVRRDKGLEHLHQWRVPDRAAFGSWFEGERELRVLVVTSTGAVLRRVVLPGVAQDDIGSWQASGVFVTTWDRSVHGDVLAYQWYEEDGGPQVDVALSIPTAGGTITTTVTWRKRDDNAGHAVVWFTDSAHREHDTGSVRFTTCGQGGDGVTGNLACASTASASGTHVGYSPDRVNDCVRDTRVGGASSWANAPGTWPPGSPEWVQVDFGSAEAVRRVAVHTSEGYPIRAFRVQVWDGAAFVTVADVTDNTSLGVSVTFPVRTTRLVRISASQGPAHQPGYVRVNELEAYST